MKLTLNKEFAKRHLFVAVLMAGLGCWFGYDGFVGYPATEAADLYKSIEGRDAPAELNLEAFKRQKIQTQYGFTFLAFLAAAVIGGHLWAVSKFDFAFDDEGFVAGGKRRGYGDIKSVDRTLWAKKGIVAIAGEGFKVKLDAWHHVGVKEFVAKIGEGEK